MECGNLDGFYRLDSFVSFLFTPLFIDKILYFEIGLQGAV